jgi:TolA-binding protein
VVLGVLGAAFVLVPRKRPLQSYLNRAEIAFQEKEFNHSVELYVQALKYYPQSERVPEILMTVGDIYNFSLGNTEQAGKAYMMITEKFPKTIFARRAYQAAGEMYDKSQQFEEALLAYQGIIDNFPNAGDIDEIRYQVAMMALKLKKYEPARRSLMAIIENNSNTPIADKVLNQLGNIFFMEGASKQAAQVLEVAVEKYPDSPLYTEMKYSLGNAYEEMGDLAKALKTYQSILQTYPNPQVIQKKVEGLESKLKSQVDLKAKILKEKEKSKQVMGEENVITH